MKVRIREDGMYWARPLAGLTSQRSRAYIYDCQLEPDRKHVEYAVQYGTKLSKGTLVLEIVPEKHK